MESVVNPDQLVPREPQDRVERTDNPDLQVTSNGVETYW